MLPLLYWTRQSNRPDMTSPITKEMTIINARGLHARATSKFVQSAEGFQAVITVSHNDMTVTGTSIMGLLMLGASLGKTITVTATGEDAAAAISAIQSLIDDKFGEHE